MSKTDPLFVVAADYRAFRAWCLRKGINPLGRHTLYVRDVEMLKGQRDIRILFIHGWQDRKDSQKIHSLATIVGRRPR